MSQYTTEQTPVLCPGLNLQRWLSDDTDRSVLLKEKFNVTYSFLRTRGLAGHTGPQEGHRFGQEAEAAVRDKSRLCGKGRQGGIHVLGLASWNCDQFWTIGVASSCLGPGPGMTKAKGYVSWGARARERCGPGSVCILKTWSWLGPLSSLRTGWPLPSQKRVLRCQTS